jgi:hypothetical protein
LFIVTVLFGGDSRVTDIAAAFAGTNIVARHRTTTSETAAEAVFLIFSPPLNRRSCCEPLMPILI